MASQTKLPKNYENNPFFVAVNGIVLLFSQALGVAILFVILSVISAFPGGGSPGDSESDKQVAEQLGATIAAWTPAEWLVAAGAVSIITLALLLVASLFGGVSSYTSAQLARGRKAAFGEAFRVAFEHLWSFLWLQIIIIVKVFLWSLLLIVPGIIMAVRYSLASVAFYDDKKNLRGNAAIQESLRLTKGAWLTTFASNLLFNILTLGFISMVISTGVNAVLYGQYDKLGDKKPQAHWLSWFTLVLPFILLTLLFIFAIFIAIVIVLMGGKFSE